MAVNSSAICSPRRVTVLTPSSKTGADGASRPRPEAFALAAYLQSLHSGAFLYEAPEHTSGAPQKQ